MQNAVSIIIPVLNEGKTIGTIIQRVGKNPLVKEIIVVDDKSFDETVAEAKKAGATVITSTKLGKGASMRDGLLVSKGNIVVYLDGDVEEYNENIIDQMISPILNNKADFVKTSFSREAGRVTELIAKPLLSILFPELTVFSQPLSGMIAGKREFLEKIQFEDDYGVDIGILIDMHYCGARIKEVVLGEIKHKMKSWRQLGQMSREVSRAILQRATKGPFANLKSLEIINILRDQMEFSIKESLLTMKKMIIFDMDNTILNGAFIDECAKKFAFENKLMTLRASDQEHYILTKNIAKLLQGINVAQLLETIDKIPFVKAVTNTIERLKKRGYIIGIITHSYDCIANHVKNKIGADFALAYELEFSNSVATGEVKIPSFFIRNEESLCHHNMCKLNALIGVAKKYKIELSNIIFMGDSEQDICAIRHTGVGVAFCSKDKALNFTADKIIKTKTFKPLLSFAR